MTFILYKNIQGELKGDKFYMVDEGQLEAFKTLN